MHRGGGHVDSGPGHAVGGATGHSGDLLSLKTLNQGGLPVNRGGAVPLLPVVIVTPCIHLMEDHNTLITYNFGHCLYFVIVSIFKIQYDESKFTAE